MIGHCLGTEERSSELCNIIEGQDYRCRVCNPYFLYLFFPRTQRMSVWRCMQATATRRWTARTTAPASALTRRCCCRSSIQWLCRYLTPRGTATAASSPHRSPPSSSLLPPPVKPFIPLLSASLPGSPRPSHHLIGNNGKVAFPLSTVLVLAASSGGNPQSPLLCKISPKTPRVSP